MTGPMDDATQTDPTLPSETTEPPARPATLKNRLLALIPDHRRNLARRLIRPAPRGLLLRRGPVSRRWGFDRGLPIDRYFIESSLARSRADIRGRVLEVKDGGYTRRFGSAVT